MSKFLSNPFVWLVVVWIAFLFLGNESEAKGYFLGAINGIIACILYISWWKPFGKKFTKN